jgi:cytochrome bd-type quinol oxidase subunit 2
MIPPGVLGFFWLLAAAAMLVNVVVAHLRTRVLVQTGQVSEAERRAFSRGAAIALVGFCLLLQVIVWLTGESRIECLAAFPPNTPASWASSLVTAVAWIVLVWWIWRGAGAERLAYFGPALIGLRIRRTPYSPVQVRRVVTAIVLLAILGGAVASYVVPPPSDCGRGRSAV